MFGTCGGYRSSVGSQRSTVNRKVAGSIPAGSDSRFILNESTCNTDTCRFSGKNNTTNKLLRYTPYKCALASTIPIHLHRVIQSVSYDEKRPT